MASIIENISRKYQVEGKMYVYKLESGYLKEFYLVRNDVTMDL